MLAEAISKLQELALAGAAPQVVTIPGRPRKAWIYRDGYEAVEVDLPAPARDCALHGLADIIRAAQDPGLTGARELFYGVEMVLLWTDREIRLDCFQMHLEKTQRFARLIALAISRKGMTQREAVRLLRQDLHRTGADQVVSAIRRLDFKRASDGSRTVEHGRESLGRAVEATCQGADAIPEEFTLRVPAFSNPGLAGIVADVRMGIYLDLSGDEGLIEIAPLPDELRAAEDAALRELGDILREALPGVPCYQGDFES